MQRENRASKIGMWICLVLAGLSLTCIALLFFFCRDLKNGSIEFEAAKSLLQIGVVSVIGTVLSLLVHQYQNEAEALQKKTEADRLDAEKQRDEHRKCLEYREALLLSVLSKTIDAYNRTKRARRLLRGRAISTRGETKVVLAEEYDKWFDAINDAQLDLESLVHDIKTSEKAFSRPELLRESLRSMEKYLNDLITEYERSRALFSCDGHTLPLDQLPKLTNFLLPGKFAPHMSVYKDGVQRAIRSDLLYPNLPKLGTHEQALPLQQTPN
jgi:hypothetical protein